MLYLRSLAEVAGILAEALAEALAECGRDAWARVRR